MYYSPSENQVFADFAAMRAYFKWVSFPPIILPSHLEYMEIYPLVYEAPTVEAHEIAEPSNIVQIDGQWTQQWTVRDRTPEEMPDPEPEEPPVDPEPEPPVQSDN